MKKILFVLTLLTGLVIMSACGGEKNPEISTPNDAYFTAKEGEYTYTFTNKQVYDELKSQVGYNLLIDMFDKDLLSATKKGNKSYMESVTEEEITEKVEEDIFLKGKENLTEDEIEKANTDFYDRMFIQFGFNTEVEVRDYYRLNLAKKAYAYDLLKEKYNEEDFTDKQYQDYYENNYKKGYYAIILAYETPNLVTKALETWNRKIVNRVWMNIEGEDLSEQEIVKTFIDLYNTANSHKAENYPESSYILNDGEEYSIVNGKIVFDLEKIDDLFYTHNDILTYDSLIQKQLSDNLVSYGEGSNFYTAAALSNASGNLHYLIMEIDEKDVLPFNEVKEEIKEKLLEGNLSSTFIATKMAELRAKNNLIIYDDEFEEKYEAQVKTYKIEFNRTKKLNGNLVAKTDVKEYSADDLFRVMSEGYGLTLVASRIEYQRLLNSPLYNKIYSMDKSLKEANRILDEDQYTAIKKEIEDEKKAFEAGEYKDYGYPASYGWKNFIKARYGLQTEEEVFEQYVYNRVRDAYGKSLGKITAADSELAVFYKTQMEKVVSEYFKVKGIQLLIELKDEKGNKVNPENWTTTQNEYAKLFYKEILEYLAVELKENETYAKRFEAIVTAYQKAPRFKAGIIQEAQFQPLPQNQYQYEGIDISKYKTAGLSVRFIDLGIFTNNSKHEELEAAVKEIWDNDPKSKTPTVYGSDKLEDIPYIITNEGYHVYVNLESTPLAEWEEGKVIPTIEQIMTYEENSSASNLTTKIKSAITNYYKPIYNELIGNNNIIVNSFKEIKKLNVSFSHNHFDVSDFNRYIELQIANGKKQLKYTD